MNAPEPRAAGPDAAVMPLRRPPIRQSTLVRAPIERVWRVFVFEMAGWWPLEPFSRGGARVRDVVVDGRVGGEVTEVWEDDTVESWGTVLRFEPPHTFAMTWNITGTPTEVTITFRPIGAALTKVDLVHGGWDRLDPDELRRACALPGGYDGEAYRIGWQRILSAFRAGFPTTTTKDGPTVFTDDQMLALLALSRDYTVCVLRWGPAADHPDRDALLWEHGRLNCDLREQGLLPITLRIPASGELAGVGVYTCGPDDVRAILDQDKAIDAGVLAYELYDAQSIPGDALP
ncbi:SRPBCC domain-containing protein [Nocardia thailandica]